MADGLGGWYIGGDFTQAGTVSRNNIAHILADGTLDSAWDPNAAEINYPAPTVNALAVSGGVVYAGGQFTSIGGQVRNNIAALDAATGLATGWNPNANYSVQALAVSGNVVYAGGWFTSIGGQARNHIAALDVGTGLATAWDANASGGHSGPDYSYYDYYDYIPVQTLAVSGSVVFAGGWFTRIGGQARSHIAALDITTGLATAWDPNVSGGAQTFVNEDGEKRIIDLTYVSTLAVSGGVVYVSGDFTRIGGQTRKRIAAVDAVTGLATDWNPDMSGGTQRTYGYGGYFQLDFTHVATFAVSGNTVYVGGDFTSIGGQPRNHIGALDTMTGLPTAWDSNANNVVNALAVSDSTVYVAGNFDSIGGQTRNRIAALDAGTGLATPWDPNAGGGLADVYSLAVSGDVVYAAGDFDSIGGQARNRIAALDATTGLATAWNPDASGFVYTVTASGNVVYVGGNFLSIGGQERAFIAALDATTGLATAWNPLVIGGVNAFVESDGVVYVGGWYTSIGGQPRNNIAALDMTTGLATAWDPNADSQVRSVVVSGGTVYVAGRFTSIGGQPRKHIAALDAATGLATSWDPNPNSYEFGVYTLAVSGNVVYAGGDFTRVGGQARNYIAALDAATGLATKWKPYVGGTVSLSFPPVAALAVSGTTVYVGGEFTSIGGEARTNFAQFDIIGDLDGNRSVNAVDVQLVINGALGLAIDGDADSNGDGEVDAVDVQLVINAALGLG